MIFVSYSRDDAEVVERIRNRLDGDSFKVWMDTRKIHGGDDWLKSIAEGIESADTFLIVLSAKSIASDRVREELTLAIAKEKPLLPVRIDEAKLPADLQLQLGRTQWINLIDFDLGYGELLLAATRLEKPEEAHLKELVANVGGGVS